MTTNRAEEIIAAVLSADDDESLPDRLCAACSDALPISGVGIVFINDTGPIGVVAATDGAAASMENLQLTLGEGPCVEASRMGRPVLQPDLAESAAERWPQFGPAVLEAGVAAIFAFPLRVGQIPLGVLDLYRDTPGMLDSQELDDAGAFAEATTRIMLQLQSESVGEELHLELSGGLAYSPVIAQSTGMISVHAGVGVGEALLLLRAHAYADERKVSDVAQDVVDRRLRFDTATVRHA